MQRPIFPDFLPLSRVRGIVFDAVGTLIEPNPSVSVAYAQAAAAQGVLLDPREIGKRFRHHFAVDEVDEHRGPLATSEQTERRRWRRLVSQCLPEVPNPGRAFDQLWEHFAAPSSWVVFSDVASGLAQLRVLGYHFCLASNFDARLRRVAAGHPELQGWCEPLVISSEIGYRKPHRLFFEAACSRLSLPANQVLSVGDDLRNDVTGASEAGLHSVLLARKTASPGETTLSNLHELVDLLGNLMKIV